MDLRGQNNTRLLICDDDNTVLEKFRKIAEEEPAFIRPVRCFQTVFSLETYLADTVRGNADVIILSADFPEKKGIRAACRLWQMYPHLLIIFSMRDLSSGVSLLFSEIRPYAPFGILNRSCVHDEVLLNLQQAAEQTALNAPRCFFLKTQYGMAAVRYNHIVYAESEKRIVHIFLNNGLQYDSYIKMDTLEQALPPHFLRIHQSYLINLDYAEQINGNDLIMTKGGSLPISRNYKTVLKERLYSLKGFC